jgi:hypothetical protein
MFTLLHRHARVSLLVLFVCPAILAAEAKPNHVKATVARFPWEIVPNATAAVNVPASSLLPGLRGRVLEEYGAATLVEIHESDKEELQRRGKLKSILVTVREEFDKIFLNGNELDARNGTGTLPPGRVADPPYPNNEQGTWLIQFVGPVKPEWVDAIRNAGIVPVQYIPVHAYMVGGRESAIRNVERLPFVQWTSQLHRFLKPSVGSRTETTVELWVELARTDETEDAVAALANLAVGEIRSANWSDAELRVEGVFRTADLDLVLAEPLVMWVSERPSLDLSDERAVLSLTNKTAGTGAGEYKAWLAALCPQCTNLQADGFYIGIADTGLDGGDQARPTDGTIAGEKPSSGLHRAELPNSRILWGTSFERTSGSWNCEFAEICPDTTGSKHDTIGHGTMVAGMAAGDPTATGGKDSGGFFWGLGVAPSVGVVVTKINPGRMVTWNAATNQFDLPVTLVTKDALTSGAYWQNFSLNQYTGRSGETCSSYYDGTYTQLSRDFDAAVIDGNADTTAKEPITLTVSSGNISNQGSPPAGCTINRFHTLPPATAKNVIAVGGAENLRPDSWLCAGARSDDFNNLSINAKRGTATPGWYKPDLIAVSSSIAAIFSSDQVARAGNGRLGSRCASWQYGADGKTFEPVDDPTTYRGATGTSFAAPIGLGAAVLASRRYNSTPGAATPSLVKAMLIAGAASMRGGKDRGGVTQWRPYHQSYAVGDRVIPTIPNGHVYEVEETCWGEAAGSDPLWPTNGGVDRKSVV